MVCTNKSNNNMHMFPYGHNLTKPLANLHSLISFVKLRGRFSAPNSPGGGSTPRHRASACGRAEARPQPHLSPRVRTRTRSEESMSGNSE